VDDIYLSETVADTLGNFVNVNGDCYFLIASNEIGGVLTVPTTITALADCADTECDRCTPICVRGTNVGDVESEYTYDATSIQWKKDSNPSFLVRYNTTSEQWEMVNPTLVILFTNSASNGACPPATGWELTSDSPSSNRPKIDQGLECDAPTSCPTTGLVDSYRIAGYVNGQFAIDAAAGISAIDPPFVQWTGQVDEQPVACLWQTFPGTTYAIDGSDASQARLVIMSIILSSGKWVINIERNCTTGGTCTSGTVVVWQGEKTTGQTPVGTYTRTAGFDTTATLDIEESP